MIEPLVQNMVSQENQMITNYEFQEDLISPNKPTPIVQFSQEYYVSETLVREALADIELTKLKADPRKKKQSDIKTKENDMAYTDLDWKSL